MNKSKITLFLAFILISGTITAFFPSSSFMTDVHALSDYGLMEDAYNSKYLQYNKENIDCTNLNLNGNGLNVNTIPKSMNNVNFQNIEGKIHAYTTIESRYKTKITKQKIEDALDSLDYAVLYLNFIYNFKINLSETGYLLKRLFPYKSEWRTIKFTRSVYSINIDH